MSPVNQADLDWWLDLAPSLDWRVASTMPDAPHSYVVKDTTLGRREFERAVKVIRTFGEPGKFYSRTNIYLTVNGTKWWTMGAPLEETIIINQADSAVVYGEQDAPRTKSPGHRFTIYDALAVEYDDRYTAPECLEENAHVARAIRSMFGFHAPSTLDVGCGTGLLLDMGVVSSRNYTGVDPSQGMLNELVRKHPKTQRLLPGTLEENVDRFKAREFELVAGLFGSASYVSPGGIMLLPALCSNTILLMHYLPGYLPDYYEGKAPYPWMDRSREAATALLTQHAGEQWTLGNFLVTEVWV